MRETLYDRVWSVSKRIHAFGKRLGVAGPFEPLLTYAAPRLVRPPSRETEMSLPTGGSLWLPGNFPSYRGYRLGLYESQLFALLPSLIQNGMSVLDIGANVGFYTIAMSRLVGEGGKVFAFEADHFAFSYLERNIVANNCTNVIAVNAAVTDRPGHVRFVPESIERGFVYVGNQRNDTVTIPAVSLDSFFASLTWPHVDFAKLDIEGGEGDALTGMTELSERNPGLKIVMEYNWPAIQKAGYNKQQLSDILRLLGFRHGWVVERGLKPLSPTVELPRASTMYNLLLAKD